MGTHVDFLECLEPDVALEILTCLDDSADLLRASAVSQHWQHIVVSNGLCKQLCIRTFPQLATITRVVEPSHDNSGKSDHRAYASLLRAITTFPLTNCIANPVSTSDNPAESIWNTLRRGFYWSSKGRWFGYPIYSSGFVRFRMGHPKSWKELNYDFIKAQECADDKFIWTYTSPMFPVAQENCLQTFNLPAPVVCIGGYLQIELLGRVAKGCDDKYYVW
ncbi:putative F-box domain-containing protein [Helianthus annuus]|nr:putative F-box domain-containing protein [Helianthus annuus]